MDGWMDGWMDEWMNEWISPNQEGEWLAKNIHCEDHVLGRHDMDYKSRTEIIQSDIMKVQI